MIQEKYFVNDESHLFTNTNKTDFKRVIEDLLDYTVGTMKSLLQQNETICKQWYEKTLADFFSELNNEARREIQQKLNPRYSSLTTRHNGPVELPTKHSA